MIAAVVRVCPVCGNVHSLPDVRSFDRKEMGCDEPRSYIFENDTDRIQEYKEYREQLARDILFFGVSDLNAALSNWQEFVFGPTYRSDLELDPPHETTDPRIFALD